MCTGNIMNWLSYLFEAFSVKKDENCNIDYNDLLAFLDRSKCPMADTIPINVKVHIWNLTNCVRVLLVLFQYDLYWGSEREAKAGTLIDWCAFNKYLDLEDTFKEIPGPPTIEALEKVKEEWSNIFVNVYSKRTLKDLFSFFY